MWYVWVTFNKPAQIISNLIWNIADICYLVIDKYVKKIVLCDKYDHEFFIYMSHKTIKYLPKLLENILVHRNNVL